MTGGIDKLIEMGIDVDKLVEMGGGIGIKEREVVDLKDVPYLVKERVVVELKYNPVYGDNRVCKCGHVYSRHFDSYEDMEACGCKYCDCREFEEKVADKGIELVCQIYDSDFGNEVGRRFVKVFANQEERDAYIISQDGHPFLNMKVISERVLG